MRYFTGLLISVLAFVVGAFAIGFVVMIFGNNVFPQLSYLQWVSLTIAGQFIVQFGFLMEHVNEATRD